MTLWASPYELKFHSVSGWKGRQGVLLKFVFEDGLEGHSDLHPWVELGDPAIEVVLDDLRGEKHSLPMAFRCVALARKDALARSEKRFLGRDAEQVLSHKLVPQLSDWDRTDFERAIDLGYTHFKIKMSQLMEEADKRWRSLAEALSEAVTWRIDMNARPSESQFEEWLSTLSDGLRKKIDFIEDPCPYSESFWGAVQGVNVACDRAAKLSDHGFDRIAAQVFIIKPELVDGMALVMKGQNKSRRYVVTNNLGHPFSLSVARAEACELYGHYSYLHEVCGLQGLEYYMPSAWTDRFKIDGPKVGWNFNSESGYGFDDLLKELPWKKI